MDITRCFYAQHQSYELQDDQNKRQRKAKKIEQKMDKLENKGLDSDTKTGLWIMGGFVVVGGAVIAIAASKNKKNDKQ